MGNNPILYSDFLGDTSIFYNAAGAQINRVDDGSKKNSYTIIPEDRQKGFDLIVGAGDAMKAYYTDADGNFNAAAYAEGLRGVGTTYDVQAFSDFYNKNGSAFTATNVGGVSVENASVEVNGKSVDPNSLKAEAAGNLVLKGGVVTVGNNPATTTNSMTRSDPDKPGYESGKVGGIHTHPVPGARTVRIDSRSGVTTIIPISGGRPSPGDHSEYTRSGQGYRFVMVDKKNVYLFNSDASQTITIPRR
jgi:hypothetical protein